MMTERNRAKREAILSAGMVMWQDGMRPTCGQIATKIGLKKHSNVAYYYPTAFKLEWAIAKYAIAHSNSRLIVQLIATDHPAVASLSDDERSYHLANIAGTSANTS